MGYAWRRVCGGFPTRKLLFSRGGTSQSSWCAGDAQNIAKAFTSSSRGLGCYIQGAVRVGGYPAMTVAGGSLKHIFTL